MFGGCAKHRGSSVGTMQGISTMHLMRADIALALFHRCGTTSS